MGRYNIDFGATSEESACLFLKKNGYKVLEKNYRTKSGEIDIIAKDGTTVCFIEVKSRSSCKFGLPQEAVSFKKQQRIVKSAEYFLKSKNWLEVNSRFDVLGITLSGQGDNKKFVLIKDAFDSSGVYTY